MPRPSGGVVNPEVNRMPTGANLASRHGPAPRHHTGHAHWTPLSIERHRVSSAQGPGRTSLDRAGSRQRAWGGCAARAGGPPHAGGPPPVAWPPPPSITSSTLARGRCTAGTIPRSNRSSSGRGAVRGGIRRAPRGTPVLARAQPPVVSTAPGALVGWQGRATRGTGRVRPLQQALGTRSVIAGESGSHEGGGVGLHEARGMRWCSGIGRGPERGGR